ncbi:hypothetical protein GCM10017709_34410 [Glutamicibacter nicotianae]
MLTPCGMNCCPLAIVDLAGINVESGTCIGLRDGRQGPQGQAAMAVAARVRAIMIVLPASRIKARQHEFGKSGSAEYQLRRRVDAR